MSEIFKKLRKLLNAEDKNYGTLAEAFFNDETTDYAGGKSVDKVIDGFTYEHLDGYGGEGCGEDFWSVYEFTDVETQEKCVVKFDGWYASYVGSEFTEMREVRPVERVVTFYE